MDLAKEVSADLTGLEQLRALIASGRRPPIAELLDFDLVEVAEGRAVFEAVPQLKHYNPIGLVHGGFAATLLDSACGCAVHSRLAADQAYATLELKVSLLKGVTKETGLLRAEGTCINFGRRAAFAEARLTDRAGKLYASASSTLLVMQR